MSRLLERLLSLVARHPLLTILPLAAATRLPFLWASPAELDETWSWFFTEMIVRDRRSLLQSLPLGIDGPLFCALNVAVGRSFGVTLEGLRLVQAGFGIAGAAMVVPALSRLYPRRVAASAALLCCFSPFLIFYSMQARPYAQLLFFTLVFVFVFLGPRDRPRLRRLGVVVATFLLVASHYYALAFLAAFYALVLLEHRRRKRPDRIRHDFMTGLISLIVMLPLLLHLAVGLSRLGTAYWQLGHVTIPGLFVEQILLAGASMGTGPTERLFDVVAAVLLLLPLAAAGRRGGALRELPLPAWIWVALPLIPVLLWVLTARNLVFYARGFIGTTPFLIAAWLFALGRLAAEAGRWRAYRLAVVFLILLSATGATLNLPSHPFFANRTQALLIAEQVERQRPLADLVVIHDWHIAQFYAYHLGRQGLVPLGIEQREIAGARGERFAAIAALEELPAEARLLLVLNRLADFSDPQGWVVRNLFGTRPLLAQLDCSEAQISGQDLFCKQVLLFGPRFEAEVASP